MHLLLIEDDEILGDGLKSVLIQNFHTVDWVRDAESSLPMLASNSFDLIILDLNLPGQSGFELVDGLREGAFDPRTGGDGTHPGLRPYPGP